MFRREWPHFIAFDVLFIDGEDLREQPLVARKRRLRRIRNRDSARCVSPRYFSSLTRYKSDSECLTSYTYDFASGVTNS
jgi:ATP-dependent DNA ligase